MSNWISKWIMFVAIAHTGVSIVFFGKVYGELIQSGLVNAVNSEKAGLAVWFFLFGLLLFILGMLVAIIEKHGLLYTSKSIGVALLILTILGVILMPASGFWFVLPAVFAILFKKSDSLVHTKT